MSAEAFYPYLLVMAGVTYLIRMLPLTVCRREIRSPFLRSFLYYVPYAVLGAMTVPDIFYATGNLWTALAGLAAGVWGSLEEVAALRRSQHVFLPQRPQAACEAQYRLWRRAVDRALRWIENDV